MCKVTYINALIAWINEHLEERLSLDIIAAKSGYSKWYLQNIFKEVKGISLGSYVRKCRLNKAASELVCGEETILNIALKYHFDCQQTFTRAFKREFSTTPAVFKRCGSPMLQGNLFL